MTLGKRIRTARERLGLSQVELAARCGWDSQARLSQYERDERIPKPSDITKLARVLGVSPSYLLFGDAGGEMATGQITSAPLLQWNEADGWIKKSHDKTRKGGAMVAPHYAVSVPVPGAHGENVFALQIVSDSMAPEFAPGDIVVFDPDKDSASGAYVLVKFAGTKEPTLRQLEIEGGRRLLKPLNPRYPIEELALGGEILAVVVFKGKQYA